MKVLRIIYIVWLVFGTILSLYGFFYAVFSNKSFWESFSLAILILLLFSILPLLPYFYYLIYDKARKIKNLFVAICLHFLLFFLNILKSSEFFRIFYHCYPIYNYLYGYSFIKI